MTTRLKKIGKRKIEEELDEESNFMTEMTALHVDYDFEGIKNLLGTIGENGYDYLTDYEKKYYHKMEKLVIAVEKRLKEKNDQKLDQHSEIGSINQNSIPNSVTGGNIVALNPADMPF